MIVLDLEELKKKYEAEALGYIKSNRSAAREEGFREENWKDIASAKSEVLVSVVQDITDLIIHNMKERQERVTAEEKKPGRYMGVADAVENGDYV